MRTSLRKKRKGRINTRVDFTPMVDMMMLLLTFFMFCTTLSKPQVMDIAMPTSDIPPGTPPNVGSEAITLILADKNKMYYYEGLPDYEDYTSLKEIKYSELRNVLLNKNKHIVAEVNKLRTEKNNKAITEQEYKDALKKIKEKKGTVAVIKPTEHSVFQNLVEVLDEMQICSVSRYAVVDMVEADNFMMENYKSKGEFIEQ